MSILPKLSEEEVPRPKCMSTQLLAFSARLHLLHQLWMLFKSACRLFKSSCSHCLFISFVSSAKMYIDEDVIALGMSLIYTMNKRGPRILPWGIPDRTGRASEHDELN